MRDDALTEIRVLGPSDSDILAGASTDVFDHPPQRELTREFLADPRHHIAVAVDGDRVVGFVSGVHYIHPDKPPELWINEIGVAESHRRMGLGGRLLETLLDVGRELGCRQAWVLTERENEAARRLYGKTGGRETDPPVMFEFELSTAPAGVDSG